MCYNTRMEERFFTAETQAKHGNYLAIQPTVNCYLPTQPDRGTT